MDDDWIDESASAEEADIKTYSKIEKDRITEGFRAGIEAGKESVLQEGFNKGYVLALEKCMELSKLRGILNAVLCYNITISQEQKSVSAEDMAKIEDMVEELSNAEKLVSSEICSKTNSSSCQSDHKSSKDGCCSNPEKNCKITEDVPSFDGILSKANELINMMGLLS